MTTRKPSSGASRATTRSTKPLVNYYLKWAESGDPRAPHYVNLYGRGSIEHIRDKMFAALAQQHSGG